MAQKRFQKIKMKHKICVCRCFIVAMIVIVLTFSFQRPIITAIRDFINNSELEKLQGLNDVLYLDNVCIELLSVPVTHLKTNFSETKKIVVYGNYSRTGQRFIRVAGSSNSLWNHWNLEFRHELLPSDRTTKVYKNTAFFVQPTCPGNFHHFLIDEFVPLYSIVTLANCLHPGAENQIVYRTPPLSSASSCNNRQRFERILWTLYTRKLHDVFYNLPPNTCFSKAVFGSKSHIERPKDAIDHILGHFNISNTYKSYTSDRYLTILSRQRRRILNEEYLSALALSVGFRNVRIIDFEKISVEDQMLVAASSNVLLGVQGAGLQWAVFMPNGSHLVEIAWPSKHWGFYYCEFVLEFSINCHEVAVTDVRENLTSYEASVRRGVQMSDDEKKQLLTSPPKSVVDNLWKWADVFVSENEIRKTLENLHTTLR